ncbi:MAG: hypothetical protein NXI20_16450 [bacterium]|nr:hypothetical protein [bacterium]
MTRLLLFSLISIFCSCTTVYFQTTQPNGVDKLAAFPAELHGTYLTNEGDTVTINENSYIYPEDFEDSFHISEVDSSDQYKIENGLLYNRNLPTEDGVKFENQNDTISYDVVINLSKSLSDSIIIKPFRGYVIMNEINDDGTYWNAYLLKPTKSGITVYVVGDFDVEKKRSKRSDGLITDFYKYTKFEQLDERKFLINPTPEELKKLIKKGFFVEFMKLEKL